MKRADFKTKTGFTMIEVLVATAILMLIMVVALNIVGSASSLSSEASKRINIRDEARVLFDRMALDFGSAANFDKFQLATGSAPLLSIITKSDAPSGRLQRVDYLTADPDSADSDQDSRMVRAVANIGWNDQQDFTVAKSTYDEVMSKNSVVMRVVALMSDGTYESVVAAPSVRTIPRPVAVVVAIAMIDPAFRSSRRIAAPNSSIILFTAAQSPPFSLSAQAEKDGWRFFQRTFRLP